MNIAQLTVDSGVEVAGKIGSPDAFKWRDASNAVGYFEADNPLDANQTNYNVCSASQMIIQTDSAVVNSGGTVFNNQIVGVNDEDFVQQGGWSVLAFRASGLPSYSTATTIFTVDIIMHIEGVPQFTSAPAISGAKYPLYHPRLLEAVQAAASALPTFRKPHHRHRRKSFMHVMDEVSRALTGHSAMHNVRGAVRSAGQQLAQEAVMSFAV
jgi:hypothetical protein